nr:MAG TPA: hypothetical protein [Caudoviricetes sp.]
MSITIFKLSLHHTIYNKHLKKKYFKQRIIHIEMGGYFYIHIKSLLSYPTYLKIFTSKNRSSLFQIESIQPITYKPNISIRKERNNNYQKLSK